MSSLMKKVKTGDSDQNITPVGELVKHFLGGEFSDTATEIVNPDGFAFSDFTVLYLADDKTRHRILGIKGNRKITDADMMMYYLQRVRKNWVANQRKSIGEGERVAIGAKQQEEKERLREKLAEGVGLR